MPIVRRAMIVISLLALAACVGETTSPTQGAAAAGDVLGGVQGGATGTVKTVLTEVTGLNRTTPLAADLTVSQSIGSAGGTLSLPMAGVTVVVPAGAVSVPTQFTMTARAGALVAYDFAPHGVTFAKPLVFTQSLAGTRATMASKSLLEFGYYGDPSQLLSGGGLLSELSSGAVDVGAWTFSANIKHFSGYMVGCGRV